MIVDDNATNRRIMEKTLSAWGMKPVSAHSAKQALAILNGLAAAGEPVQLVLSDVNMPDHDGYELAEWIRSQPVIAETRIVLLTSSNRQGELQLRRELKIEGQLLKPVKQSDLLEAISQAMGLSLVSELDSSEEANGPTTEASVRPLRILLAEDNHVNQRLALGMLEKHGHQVIVAEDGQQAVDFYRDGEYDLILMDVQMPICDGLEATRRIRQLEQGTPLHVPIIAMTAHALVGDRDRCLAAGMDDFISKPIRIAQVLQVIGDATGTLAAVPSLVRDHPSSRQDSPCVDWKHALDTVGGDQVLLRELAQVFVDEAASMLDDVLNAGSHRSAKDLRRSAHSIKGALNHLGATLAAETAYALEQCGESEEFGDVPQLCDQLRDQLNDVVHEFRTFMAKPPAS